MLLQKLLGWLREFHGDKFEAFLLKALDDLAHQSSLNAIRLHHNIGTLRLRHDPRVELEATKPTELDPRISGLARLAG